MSIQSGERSRFTDLCDEPIDHLLSPIKGYQDQTLVTLNEAIQPISPFFNEIEDNVFVALHNCQNPADDLTQQESASIHLYTMQFDGGPSFYFLLNQSLRAENREELKPWFSFLKLFLTALYKLPGGELVLVLLILKYSNQMNFWVNMGYELFFQLNVLMENLLPIILILKIQKKKSFLCLDHILK